MKDKLKILTAAWVVYEDKIPIYADNRTGGGLIIWNLCKELGRTEDSYLITWKDDIDETELDDVTILSNYVGNRKKLSDEKEKSRLERIAIRTKAFEYALNRVQPDVVSFQGLSEISIECMKICDKYNVKYIYTEHLFIRQQVGYGGVTETYRLQNIIYNMKNLNIIAVSTGMKKYILQDFPDIDSDKVKIILNGTDFEAENRDLGLREKLNIRDKKILICVGSICKRKNQIMLVEAMAKMDKKLRNSMMILILGNDRLNGELQNKIFDYGLDRTFLYLGAVSNDEMKDYYSIAEGLIMPSYAEGLSIAALEMLSYGKPIIMFADSECAEDLNDNNVACLAEDRTVESLLDAIKMWYCQEWNEGYIKNYSSYFSIKRVAADYLKAYEQLIESSQ